MLSLHDLSTFLVIREGFCHPDWDGVARHIGHKVPETEWNAAWETAARAWVAKLRDGLGGTYQIYESPNFLILADAQAGNSGEAGRCFESAREELLACLDGIAEDDGYGKHVVLIFGCDDDYYDYIKAFHTEGEHPMSGGMCILSGYVHLALQAGDAESVLSVFVHELAHACLAHLPLPAWLDEALAKRMQELVCGTRVLRIDRELLDRHKEHWNPPRLQQFWSGESWEIPGESFELSYDLAVILWRRIESELADTREHLLDFVASATDRDAGEAACQAAFGVSLGELVTDFLGEGDWTPDPAQ